MTDQEKRKKVIKGLEMHATGMCNVLTSNGKEYCPYWENNDNCTFALLEDARSLLKAQEPRVMTLEEVEDALDSVVWVDKPLLDNSSSEYALIDSYSRKLQIVELRYPLCGMDYMERSDYATYGKRWRCWTSRPTDEQREATPWE